MCIEVRKTVRENRWVKGGYTVEAAVLLPLGIALVLFLVSAALILHDRVAVCAWIHEAAQWEGFQKKEGNHKSLSEVVILSQMKEKIVSDGEMVTVKCEGEGQFLSGIVRVLFLLEAPRLEGREYVKRIYGEQVVRSQGVSEGVYEGGSDLQKGAGP